MLVESKICYDCETSKDVDEFYTISSLQCKSCIKKLRREYYLLNTEKIKTNNAIRRENNKEDLKVKAKVYRQNNLEDIKAASIIYRLNNLDILLEYGKKYREDNKEELAAKALIYTKERLKNDPVFKIRKTISRMVNVALKKKNVTKSGKSITEYLTNSLQDIKIHIESLFEPWMNWQNKGTYVPENWDDNDQSTFKWNLDHIIPQSDLPYTSMEDENFKKCWSLDNLRPLNAKQNVLDGIKRTRHKGK